MIYIYLRYWYTTQFPYHMMFVWFESYMTCTTSGPGTTYPPQAPVFTPSAYPPQPPVFTPSAYPPQAPVFTPSAYPPQAPVFTPYF